MSRPKRLTRQQKIFLSKKGFQTPGQFLLIEDTAEKMILHDKGTGTTVTVPKNTKGPIPA